MTQRSAPFDLAAIRHRLTQGGSRQWSSVEELTDDDEFRRWVEAEFPAAATILAGTGRRTFLKLMGASLMMAGLAGCGEGRSDAALPYVNQPENAPPGIARHFATAVTFEGYAQPVLATVYNGRPTKLDGNPEHPAARGASDAFMQAALLQLYDPMRSKTPLQKGQPTTWAAIESMVNTARAQWTAQGGMGLRFVVGDITSPTIIRQLRTLISALPEARIHRFEPVGCANRQTAMQLAFGRVAEPVYALEQCEAIVSLDDDLLGPGPWQVWHAQGWAKRRGEMKPGEGRARVHVAECVPGLTGVVATTRLAADPPRITLLAGAIAARLGVMQGQSATLSDAEHQWVTRAAEDLDAHRGRSLFSVGAHAPARVQAVACAVNEKLGNVGRTVRYREPMAALEGGSLADLARDMQAGAVTTVIVLDCNPAYAAPAELRFAEALGRVPTTLHAGLYADETAAACGWHVPLSHALESWGDARAVDGSATILQPVIGRLYQSRTVPEVLAMLSGAVGPDAQALVRETWAGTFGDDFDGRWRQALHDGIVQEEQPAPLSLSARVPDIATEPAPAEGIDIVFRPDPCVWDGRFSDVAWLQELPKPLTKITWDCPVAISPQLADTLKVGNGDFVELAAGPGKIAGPVWVMPGQAANTAAVFLGYGRAVHRNLSHGLGYAASALRGADDPWHVKGTIRRVDGHRSFATSQLHHRMEGFDFVKEVTASRPTTPPPKPQPTLYPEKSPEGYGWAMSIDLDRCIGCNACIAACNIENNVLVVGRDQVAMGREMLWLRVDRYYSGDIENPRSYFQPVPCMHCEMAPCEMGCPVNATTHSPEGLNQQIYNRCIGTRTCSSYCPYKVRRFNWFDYRKIDPATDAAHNPDVTVRSRGVMEKCTYCVQRIEAARAAADKENRDIRPGEVTTACQQACPTQAISFGNMNNGDEEVSKRRRSGRHYVLLEEVGTRPRTTYLARWNDDPGGEGA